jgi:hypothetical protein
MNSSVYSADRATHLKVVVTTLVASIGIVALATPVRRMDTRSRWGPSRGSK